MIIEIGHYKVFQAAVSTPASPELWCGGASAMGDGDDGLTIKPKNQPSNSQTKPIKEIAIIARKRKWW